MDQPWTERSRPQRLERRVEFADYEATRSFLERLEALSQQHGRFPDISFGRTYVNITLRPDEAETPVGDVEHGFAAAVDELL
jgi:4a-hydroxytetrahydrobiopterin dehydratase